MTQILKDLFGARVIQLGLAVLVIALVAGFWWQGGEPAGSDAGGVEKAIPSGSADNGIEADAYEQPDATVPLERPGLLVAARPPLDDGAPPVENSTDSVIGTELRAIPQSEPGPLAEPPSFDSGTPISRTATLPADTAAFPEPPREVSSGRHPLENAGSGEFADPLEEKAEDRLSRERSGAGTAAVIPAARPGFQVPAGAGPSWQNSGAGTDTGSGSKVTGLATGPRSLEPSREALPIVTRPSDQRTLTGGETGGAGAAVGVHAVRSGDSYWTISRQHYGSARYFQALSAFNQKRIPDPRMMRPGMKVLVPSREFLESRFAKMLPRVASLTSGARTVGFQIDVNGHPVYAVGPDDTLTGIAGSHLGRTSRWIQIYRLNRDQLPSPHKLKQGMVLRMPADAARLPGGGR